MLKKQCRCSAGRIVSLHGRWTVSVELCKLASAGIFKYRIKEVQTFVGFISFPEEGLQNLVQTWAFKTMAFYWLHMALIPFLIKTKDLVLLITFYSNSSRRSFISGLHNKYQALGKVKFWHISIKDHSLNNFWHISCPSQNIYKYCFSPIIQTLHLSKANWLNYLPLPYFPLLHTHTTHCTLSKDLLFFCSFSEFVCLDSDSPAGLKKKCNTNKL